MSFDDTTDQTEEDYIVVGSRVVIVDDGRTGIVKFIGPVHFAPGVMCGIELDPQFVGTSNGTVNGWNYFDSPDDQAVFVKKVELEAIGSDYIHSRRPSEANARAAENLNKETRHPRQGVPLETNGRFPSMSGDNYNYEYSGGDDGPGAGDQGPIYENDKLGRKIRGMGNVLDDELLDFKSDPNETDVCVYYALKGLSHDEISHLPKSRLRNAISKALPEDLRDEISPKDFRLSFEKMDDYTEMKVETECKSPETGDDLKWTMLDPRHVRRFNDNCKEDTEMDQMNCEYTYLERQKDNCCKWIKPCICCICCWLVLLTILTSMLFAAINALGRDVDDLQKNRSGGGGIPGDLEMKVTDLVIQKQSIDSTGSALVQCPDHDYELIGCWVYIGDADQWDQFITYDDLDPKGYPDCSCYCQHIENSYSCSQVGGECRAQCARFGHNWADIASEYESSSGSAEEASSSAHV